LPAVVILLVTAAGASAQDGAPSPAEEVQTNLNFVWTLIAAVLVFSMQAGFAMVETGFTRAKNAINIMMKNLMDFSVGTVAFWAVGFALMFGVNKTGFFGTTGWFFSSDDPWGYCFLIFQVVFCATAATIVSGAMAERTKFVSYLVYSAVLSAFVYPIFGSWAWGGLFQGGGWLENMGFIDFAGSTVVHSIGGWAALAGAIVLGPRFGKYDENGRPRAIPGHNIPLATLGVFILWFGWFGFNAGSTTTGNADIALIAFNTNLSAAAGAITAMISIWAVTGKPEISMTLNGALAGLVGITAGCANVEPVGALVIGAVAGVIVVFAVLGIDRIGIDDPVGAVSVHGVCGAWGTLAAAIFSTPAGILVESGSKGAQIVVQLIGIGAAFAWTFGVMFIIFTIIKLTIGLRVSEEEEREGLDVGEHGASAYPDFQTSQFFQ
jgi:Amt family ammonium transporter